MVKKEGDYTLQFSFDVDLRLSWWNQSDTGASQLAGSLSPLLVPDSRPVGEQSIRRPLDVTVEPMPLRV